MSYDDELLTAQEAAEFLRISEKTLGRWVEKGLITSHELPMTRGRRYWRSELVELVKPTGETG